MKKVIAPVALALCLALALAGPAAAAGKPKGRAPLATAGPVTVSPEEFTLYVAREAGVALATLKPEARRRLLTRFVVRKALAAKAEKDGLAKDPVLEKSLNQWKYQNYPERYWSEAVDAKVEVTERELWDAAQPVDEYNLAAINFGVDEEAVEIARRVSEEFAGGADFRELARKHSLGIAAQKGGDLGWMSVPNQSVTEEMAAEIRKLKVGQLSPPLETPVGIVVFLLRDRRTAAQNFEKVKGQVREQVRSAKVQRARAARAAELRAKASISYPAKSTPGGRGPLAVVNGAVILPEAVGADEHVAMSKAIATKEKRLEQLIDVLLVVQDAERLGIDKQPALREGLALERTLVLASLGLHRAAEERPPTEAEIRAEYARYYVPEVYGLQMIATAERARAEEALSKVREGKDFGAVAKEYAAGRLGAGEGKLAPGPIVDFPPAVRAAIEGAPDGGVTGVLDLGDGRFAVVKRLGKKTIAVPPLEEVESSIRMRLGTRRRADRLETVINEFGRSLKITIDEELLATL